MDGQFAQPLAMTNSGRPAVIVLPEMYEPTLYQRAHYDAIATAIGDLLSRR